MDTVLIGGVFDPLHAGHLAYLREARKLGGVAAAVSDDPAKHQPLVPIADRMALLEAMGAMYCIRHTGQIPQIIRGMEPTYYVKGEEWRGRLPAEEIEACKQTGTEIVYVFCRTNSSSLILQDYQRRLHEQGVREFESFCAQQKPADKPWEPVTDYSWEARVKAEGPHAQIIKDVFQPSSALDYGSGFGHLLSMLRALGVPTRGYEPNIPDRALMPPTAKPNTVDELWMLHESAPFPLVICREVLEHLTVREIRQTIPILVRLSSRYIYLTTRFNDSPRHLLDIQGSDTLDPTHISLLPKELLRSWFIAEGCKSRPDLEQRMDWQHKGRCLVFEV